MKIIENKTKDNAEELLLELNAEALLKVSIYRDPTDHKDLVLIDQVDPEHPANIKNLNKFYLK